MYVGEKPNEKQYRGVVALGIDPAVDQEVRDYEITAGARSSTSEKTVGGIMLDETFAQSRWD